MHGSENKPYEHRYREGVVNSKSQELRGYMYVGDYRDVNYQILKKSYGPWRVVTHHSQMSWPPPRAIIFGKSSVKLKCLERIKGVAIRLSGVYGTEVNI